MEISVANGAAENGEVAFQNARFNGSSGPGMRRAQVEKQMVAKVVRVETRHMFIYIYSVYIYIVYIYIVYIYSIYIYIVYIYICYIFRCWPKSVSLLQRCTKSGEVYIYICYIFRCWLKSVSLLQ